MTTNRMNAADFFTGFFAALALRETKSLSLREQRLDRALADVFNTLVGRAEQEGLDIRFRIRLDPIHGDSMTVRDSVYGVIQRDLISLDNPEFQEIRLKIGSEEAEALLEKLPGGKRLFLTLADEFLSRYRALATV